MKRKSNYSGNMMKYFEEQAERKLDNFLGDDHFMDEHDNFAGHNGIDKIKDFDRTLTVIISNTSSVAATAIVFGALVYPGAGDSFQETGISVTVDESSHDQVRAESVAGGMHIKGWKLIINTGSTSQFAKKFAFARRSSGGSGENGSMQPLNYKSATQQQDGQIDAPDAGFDITGADYVAVVVNPSTSMTWVLTIDAKVAVGQFLNGKAAIQTNHKPVPGHHQTFKLIQ